MSNEIEQQDQQNDPSIVAKKNYNPFFQNVNEKPYTQMSVGVEAGSLDIPIAEPTYQPHNVNTNENPYDMLGGDGGGSSNSGGSKGTPPPFNPSMNDIPDKDKALGAQHMAKLLVDGYEQLHHFANKALQFPEKKISKLVRDGEIDLSIQIPYEFDKTISAGEFIHEFNEQNKDALSVSKEFKKEVTPVLTRVLEKRGAGLTDEQYLGFLVGKDLVVKLVIVAQMRSTMNDVINSLKDATQAQGATPPPPPPPSQPRQATTPPPTQPVYQDQTIDTNATDFNFQTNESVMNSSVQQMKVPKTGKERVIAQIQKEKKWKKDAENATTPSSYDEAMKARNNNGKRGRKKKPSDYVKMDEDEIAEAIILNESVNQPKKEKDPYADL